MLSVCPSDCLLVCISVCLLVRLSVNVPSSSFYGFCDCFRSSEKTRIANFRHASMISRHWNSICIVHTPRCPQAHIPRSTGEAARGQGRTGHSSDAQERRGRCRGSHLAFVFRRVCGSASQQLVASSGNAWQIYKQIYVCIISNLCKYIAGIYLYVQPHSIHTHLIACCAIKLNQFCICLIIVIIISISISTSITFFCLPQPFCLPFKG